ncbi:peptidyl-prolyl cis-trans isomerase [Yamadazyma tenuis]|uniref:peptidylprolyl isomerase n=1 Tax=Candida tenuis (strain ATCC 10573 / BCRC 21748 / CBS 615 / JCM 9827 / NBRC 10315 / NRRL Y-1498 / VKM Y-70) TaxID=590646 RepID=G3AXP6_CANTC|nr:uncharacterized protein CANTEDRAFT_112536 [Yamadazyma tenuis ATCC 10573]XP_006684697.1 uncharacterized protein CANTEDRAFT_112536 [Yamadazyma tenuis ATCC 10573]EGV66122.1 hypothetical protein CANTEDRAFT_112536 [Yamadazyma tenuis ATCC 10573]EGV66123.1 hypothetical protein CANTEDRAFT_112536 [Yamadazyma tenuis ATCC 10573]WEJ96022.1 peptidyl-prolyl cis-trans isomerase [Yamadazyma tenuis]
MKVEPVRTQAFMDVSIGGKPAGRIVVELFEDMAPLAALNFINLCTNTDGYTYKHNYFHRVIKNFMIQAGDVVNCVDGKPYTDDSVGTSNISTVNGEKLFPLENQQEPLDASFKLCTANANAAANGSQFFITTHPQSHLNGKHTVFGRVVHGKWAVRQIEQVNTNPNNCPTENEKVVIEDCGIWEESMSVPVFNSCADTTGGDIYEEYPDDDEQIDKESSESVFNASTIIKESGTLLLKQGRKQDALFKYHKCLRYVMEYIPDDEQEPQWYEKYYDLRKKLYLNMALVYLQVGEPTRAIDFASYLLDLKASTAERAKAHYRRGLAYVAKNQFSEAVNDFTEASKYVPNDEAIKRELKRAEDSIEKKKRTEKARYAKFYQ